ncbi:MAG: TonB-dependent receptor, partial [Paludibacter sp.]|nr:TonB-dependent receptor [Paludibacter sp.]
MKKKLKNILLVGFSLLCLCANAQNSALIEGTVYEKTGSQTEPIMGVNVVITTESNRTLTGITTDVNGKYSLKLPDYQGKLKIVFSFIGMKPQSFDYSGQRTLNVTLTDDAQVLKDVTVTGKRIESELGITTHEQTFSSQKIKMDALISDMPVVSVEEALQGKISGLDILAGGDPGSRSSIRIRGTATLNSKTDPLIVINGVPYSTEIDDNFDFNTANDEDFAAMLNLNPNDIESIEVLK